MRVAFVSAHYAPFVGGVEKHIIELARRMATLGHDVHVVTHHEPHDDCPAHSVEAGVTVHRFDVPVPSRNYAVAPGLWRHLAAHASDFDIVHAHGYHALPALAAALAKRSPLVFTPHYHGTGHSPLRKALHPPYRLLGGRIFARAEQVIAVSPPERDLILSHFPRTAARMSVIPNGVDVALLDGATPFDTTGTVLLSAGRIETYKQVDKVVRAVEHLDDAYSLRVTGDGPARAGLETLVQQHDLADRVEILGRVSDEDLFRWFRTGDVFISMSGNEAMPITLVEVLAAGMRVVASDIPAHRSMVDKTQGSIELVPLDAEPSVVAGAVRRVLAAPLRRPKIDTWDDVAGMTLEVYAAARRAHAG